VGLTARLPLPKEGLHLPLPRTTGSIEDVHLKKKKTTVGFLAVAVFSSLVLEIFARVYRRVAKININKKSTSGR
jgi:hypothetical protein